MTEKLCLRDLDPDKTYKLVVTCGGCGHQLNESVDMTGKDMKRRWAFLIMGGPLCHGSCPNGCRPTFSDCNLRTKQEIVEVVNDA